MNYIVLPGISKMDGISKKNEILRLIADYFDITIDDLKSKTRKRQVVYPRQIAMFILRRSTVMSLKAIGEEFGQDHTTVIHSKQNIKDLMDVDQTIRGDVEFIQSKLRYQ